MKEHCAHYHRLNRSRVPRQAVVDDRDQICCFCGARGKLEQELGPEPGHGLFAGPVVLSEKVDWGEFGEECSR